MTYLRLLIKHCDGDGPYSALVLSTIYVLLQLWLAEVTLPPTKNMQLVFKTTIMDNDKIKYYFILYIDHSECECKNYIYIKNILGFRSLQIFTCKLRYH